MEKNCRFVFAVFFVLLAGCAPRPTFINYKNPEQGKSASLILNPGIFVYSIDDEKVEWRSSRNASLEVLIPSVIID